MHGGVLCQRELTSVISLNTASLFPGGMYELNTPLVDRVPVPSCPYDHHFPSIGLVGFCQYDGYKEAAMVVLICISPMTNEFCRIFVHH